LTLIDPFLLRVGLVLTALILLGLWGHAGRRRRLAVFLGGRQAMARLSRSDLYRRGIRRVALLTLGGVALAVAAAEPRWVAAPEPQAPISRVVFAIDVSASMQTADEEPTRLAQSVAIADRLIDALEGQEVGLLLFAGTSYPIAPPTLDHDALRFLLRGVAPTVASAYDPGTLLSSAIRDAAALLERPEAGDDSALVARAPEGERLIILIGDGDDGEPDASVGTAVRAVRDQGIIIHTVGIGTARGGRMTISAGPYQLGGPVVDDAGLPGRSPLRESLLQSMASTGHGRYAAGGDEGALGLVESDLRALSTIPRGDVPREAPAWARYDLPFLLGLLGLVLVVIESLLGASLPRLRAARAREAA
jgi:Ca-activated chloride channel homolog